MGKTKTEQLRKLLARCQGGTLIHIEAYWVQELLELVEAAEKAEKLFMAINDGFFAGLVPPEFAPVSMALRKWNGGE